MRNLTIATILAACVAVPTLAAADHEQTADPAYRGGGRTKLAEVSADPRDGVDVIGVGRGRFDQLEIVATNDDVTLQRMEIRFTDGRVLRPRFRGILREGSTRLIDLPVRAAPIASIVLDYGSRHRRMQDRTSARIKLYGLEASRFSDRRFDRRRDRDDRFDDRFDGRYDGRYDRYPRYPRQR